MNPCKITEDLMPLYVDNTCSPGSREYVEEHVRTCPDCRNLLESMNQSLDVVLPRQNVKQSFHRLSRRLITHRALAITLCVLLGLAGLLAACWRPINAYLFHPLHFPFEDLDIQLSRLSDGSIYVSCTYTGDQYCLGARGQESDSSGRHSLNMQHSRLYDFLKLEDEKSFYAIIPTAESQYVYDHMLSPAVILVIYCQDGEHVLWEAGDELPPASAEAEAILQERIESGLYIPIEEYRKRLENGEIEFGLVLREEALV